MKQFLPLFIASICLHPQMAYAAICEKSPDTTTLRSSWVDEDLEFLNGRKDVTYYFETAIRLYPLHSVFNLELLETVRTDPFYAEEIEVGKSIINRLNGLIDLELHEVSSRRLADLVILGVCIADTGTEGILTTNFFDDQYYVVLNGCNGVLETEGAPELLFLHELGHALGLEHPFDDSDGDCLFSNKPWSKSAPDASISVMAYKAPKTPVEFFTDLDLATLQSIHGKHETAKSYGLMFE